MNETVFDKEMKDMLHRCADELHAPDKLKTRVDFALKNGSSRPRRRWGRRLIALAAVAAITVTGAFAAGAFGSITSHSWANQRMSLAQTQEHMEQAGVEFTLPRASAALRSPTAMMRIRSRKAPPASANRSRR